MSRKQLLGIIESLILNALESLKDEEYQKRVWFRNEGPESNSYFQVIEYFISRCELLFNIEDLEELLGNDNYEALKTLYDLVIKHLDSTESKYGDADSITENELLNDPKWHDIQSLAEETEAKLKEFLKRKHGESHGER